MRLLRRHASTLDELESIGELAADDSIVRSTTWCASEGLLVVEFAMVSHGLARWVDAPPSDPLGTNVLPSGAVRTRWRSPLLHGQVLVGHANGFRRRPRAWHPGEDAVIHAERLAPDRFRVRVGGLSVRTDALDVTIELTDRVVGSADVDEVLRADGTRSSGWQVAGSRG